MRVNRATLLTSFTANLLARANAMGCTSQRSLAKRSGISRKALNGVITGRQEPRFDTICAVAAALECEAWELMKPGTFV